MDNIYEIDGIKYRRVRIFPVDETKDNCEGCCFCDEDGGCIAGGILSELESKYGTYCFNDDWYIFRRVDS